MGFDPNYRTPEQRRIDTIDNVLRAVIVDCQREIGLDRARLFVADLERARAAVDDQPSMPDEFEIVIRGLMADRAFALREVDSASRSENLPRRDTMRGEVIRIDEMVKHILTQITEIIPHET